VLGTLVGVGLGEGLLSTGGEEEGEGEGEGGEGEGDWLGGGEEDRGVEEVEVGFGVGEVPGFVGVLLMKVGWGECSELGTEGLGIFPSAGKDEGQGSSSVAVGSAVAAGLCKDQTDSKSKFQQLAERTYSNRTR
jgi:hypothetical protein